MSIAALTRKGVDVLEMLAQEGRVFTANMGTVTTPITFLVTAANRPDAWVRVPAATTIYPISISVTMEAMAGTATEVDVRVAANDIGNGTSSAADVGPVTLRTGSGKTSLCIPRQLATADTTAETTPISIFRKSYILANAAGEDSKGFHITREQMGYPVLQGAATWELFLAATTTQATGFVVMTWAEVLTVNA